MTNLKLEEENYFSLSMVFQAKQNDLIPTI